ncbi:hypothetical protein EDB86DRAFT_2953825 [Lactarius hatsudake]|nr:hypothetical protein EDB86DRAFT_2953825 [Lactarius hatsudake]
MWGSRLRRLARFVTIGVPLKYPGAEALTPQPLSHASRFQVRSISKFAVHQSSASAPYVCCPSPSMASVLT